jgi:dihydroflavonol-4-reductase
MAERLITLLTGGTGFLGSAVARAMVARGHNVVVLARPETPRGVLDGVNVAYVPGDLTDPASLRQALDGCDSLIHCAADYRIFVPDPARMHAVNVTGTEALMRAALDAKLTRIVHVSSVATLKPRADGKPATEMDAATIEDAIGPYKKSKTEAERLVERMVLEGGLPATIVLPSTPIGPRDRRPTPTGRVILEAGRGRMPAYVETGLNLVHVDDCAAGVVAALERGTVGQRYILGGQDVRLADLIAFIGKRYGHRRARRLPRLPLFPLAWLAEQSARLTGREPMLTRDGLRMAGHVMFFSAARAVAELGFEARPWQQGVDDALDWFEAQGML